MVRKNNSYKTILKICIIGAFIILSLSIWKPMPHIEAALDTYNNNAQDQNRQIEEQELLAQTERQKNLNPFAGPLKLTGVLITNNTSDNLAIVESNNTSYIVKQGDIIADYWAVEKIDKSSIVLKAGDRQLILGKELSANIENERAQLAPSNIYLSVKDSDIRDVLSIIAIHMDLNAIFLEEPVRVTFEVNNVEPIVALELMLQSNSFSYIKNKDIIIAGELSKLQQKFFDQMMITRFDLKYISSGELKKLIQELGIAIENITVEENPKSIWLQGTPQALSKVKELIDALDRPENTQELTLFPFKLNNISAADAAERLELFGFDGVKTISFNYPEFSKDLMVICSPQQKTKVIRALEGLDWRGLNQVPEEITLPVDAAYGPNAYDILRSRRDLLIKIVDGLNKNPNAIEISDILWDDEGEQYRLLLVKGSPDFIQLVKNTVELIKSP